MKYIHIVLLLFYAVSVFGQISQINRIELPFKYSDENYIMALAGQQGLVLFRESKEKIQKTDAWDIIVLDTALQEKFNILIEVDYKYSIIGYEYRDGFFYMLFNSQNTSKNDLYLVKTSLEDGEITKHLVSNELKIEASHLLINGRSIVLGGDINDRPTFIVFDYIENKVQVVPGFFNVRSEVLDFNYDKKHDLFNVLMGQKNALNHSEIVIKSFDSSGKLVVDEKKELDKNWRLLNGRLLISEDNQIVISGSYGANNSYYSQGYYFGKLAPGKELLMSYIGFTDIDHFFDYMKPKRAQKIKSKIDRTRDNYKPYEFKTQVYVHVLTEHNGEFTLVSELYKPEFDGGGSLSALGYQDTSESGYRSKTSQKYVAQSSKLANTEGASHISYQQTNVIGFDINGKVLWDQSMTLNDVETLALEQVAEVHKKDDIGVLLYQSKDTIYYKQFYIDGEVLADSTMTINTFNEFDQLNANLEYQGGIQRWYDDYFIVWGYQKISNSQSSQIDKKRNIFFINKLLIE